MAVDAVRVAFRTGAHVLDIAHRIESPDASDQSWLLYVPAVEAAETALKAFREHTVRNLVDGAPKYVLLMENSF